MEVVVVSVEWRHIPDDYFGMTRIRIWGDASQIGILSKALAVAAMMVVMVMMRRSWRHSWHLVEGRHRGRRAI